MEAAEREEGWPEEDLLEEEREPGGTDSYGSDPDAYETSGSAPEDFYGDDSSFPRRRKKNRKPPHEDRTVRYSSHRNQKEPEPDWQEKESGLGYDAAGSGYEDWEEEDTDEP